MNALPDAIGKLRDRLVTELDAEVEVDSSDGNRDFTLWVVSPRFKGITHLQRQDLAWALVDKVCSREESMMITLIMTYAPGEIDEFVGSLGAKK